MGTAAPTMATAAAWAGLRLAWVVTAWTAMTTGLRFPTSLKWIPMVMRWAMRVRAAATEEPDGTE